MRYIIKQKFFSLGDSFAIKNEAGNDIFIVRSQLLSFGKKLRIFDLLENELCYIEQKVFRFMPEYDIYMAGNHVANVKKKFAFLKQDFVISSSFGSYYVAGDLWAREFEIFNNGSLIARISKQFFSFSDTYGVDIDDQENQIANLALAIVIDMVCHDNDK